MSENTTQLHYLQKNIIFKSSLTDHNISFMATAKKKPAKKATKTPTIKKAAAKKIAVKKSAPKKVAAKKKSASKKPAKAIMERPTTVNAYLTFNGNCEEAFNHYRSVFGGEFIYFGRFKDVPGAIENNKVSAADADKIMHVSLPISAETIVMGSDTSESMGQKATAGNNFSLSVGTGNKKEADRLFNGLSKGGKITMPMNTAFWGSYFGMFTDKFGIQWMISYVHNNN
jgi:PhnB protein